MKFFEFIRMLNNYLQPDYTQQDFLSWLFFNIVSKREDDNDNNEEFYPFSKESDNATAKKIYSGKRKIPKNIARFTKIHYEPNKLIDFVNDLEEIVSNNLCNELNKKGVKCSVYNLGQTISDCLEAFLDASLLDEDCIDIGVKAKANISINSLGFDNLDTILLLEEENICPLCGKSLTKHSKNDLKTKYKIVDIFSDNMEDDDFYKFNKYYSVNGNYEAIGNKIALCADCALKYETNISFDLFVQLADYKKTVIVNNAVIEHTEDVNIDEEINNIVKELASKTNDRNLIPLGTKALRINKKIDKKNILLKNKIKNNVTQYYKYVEGLFRDSTFNQSNTFNCIAAEMKIAYEKLEAENLSQDEIFDGLTDWMLRNLNVNNRNRQAVEIVISFFVQNCEVFHEISQ